VGWTWRLSISLATRQFPRLPYIFCTFCPVQSLLSLWAVLPRPHQDLWLCNLLSDGWHEPPLNEVVEALAPNILVHFLSLLHHGSSLCNTLSTSLQFLQLQSNFCQSLTRYSTDVAGTFALLVWIVGRAALNFLLSSLLPVPHTCLPAAAVYPLWAFSVPRPSVLDISSYLGLLFLSFSWLLWKSHQISVSFLFATWRIQSFLWLLPAGLSWYLFRDLPVQPPVLQTCWSPLLQTVLPSVPWVFVHR